MTRDSTRVVQQDGGINSVSGSSFSRASEAGTVADRIGHRYLARLDGARLSGTDWQAAKHGRAAGFRFRVTPASAPIGGFAKRSFDVVLSLLLLPAAAILALPIGCLIALNGGAPVYGHLRVGWNGKIFRCYKFRTMVVEAEDELQAILEQNSAARLQWLEHFKLDNDPRVTRLGRFLRNTGLDEIPQIWNVLRGEMSLVGPRPVIPGELDKYREQICAYLACRPGVTGLWQVRRRRNTTYDERVAFDVDYARNWSIGRDILIFTLTLPRMFASRNRG